MNRHNVMYDTYADDIQLYITCKNNETSTEEAVNRLQDCISEISLGMSQNALKINEDKTKFIIFRKKQNQLNEVNLTIGKNVILCEESMKILGVTLDCELNMVKHVTSNCRASYMHIRRINSISGFLTEHATKILMTSTVLTHLDYCNSTYAGLPQKSLSKLQLAQNTAARVFTRSGVVGNFLLWERWHGIYPIVIRGGGVCLNELSFIKGKNPGSNIYRGLIF